MIHTARAIPVYLGMAIAMSLLLVLAGSAQQISPTSDVMFENRNEPRDHKARQKVAPAAEDTEAYKVFLKQPKTGIARLVFQQPCSIPLEKRSGNPDQLAKECPTHWIPGGGSNFSFRRNDYVAATQADVTIKGKVIYSKSTAAQGIMVSLGDLALDDISLATDGIAFLDEFVPGKNIEEADLQSTAFDKGVRRGNFLYARGFNLASNSTFALRVVAYRANLEKKVVVSDAQRAQISRSMRNNPDPLLRDMVSGGVPIDPEMKSDPLFGDERKDIIVVFRIIKIEPDGSVTLIWKELKRMDSPKLDIDKK